MFVNFLSSVIEFVTVYGVHLCIFADKFPEVISIYDRDVPTMVPEAELAEEPKPPVQTEEPIEELEYRLL